MREFHVAETAGQTVRSAESAGRSKMVCLHFFLREEYRSGTTSRGKPLWYSADHRSRPSKTGLPALERSMSDASSSITSG
jgi:hypothetical protein